MEKKAKSPHAAYVCTAEHREAQAPRLPFRVNGAGDVKPAAPHMSRTAAVRTRKVESEHNPLPKIGE